MPKRLNPTDTAILAAESRATPMHNATVEIFELGKSGFSHAVLKEIIAERISFVPRYRQRLLRVPGGVAAPVWVDDEDFDLDFHVRQSALPAGDTVTQLAQLVARIVSRPLDQNRPPWEIYFIEGLAGNRVALLSKSHQVLVDGRDTVDLGQVLLDTTVLRRQMDEDDWQPRRAPGRARLLQDAIRDQLAAPVATTLGAVETIARQANTVIAPRLPGLARKTAGSPLVGALSEHRRIAFVDTALEDYRRVRQEHGGTVNDVILATVTGALRSYLNAHAGALGGRRTIKAMVPMSVIDDELEPTSLGSQIAGHLVRLPIAEASPVMRLHQVSYAFKDHSETTRTVAANRLAGIAGFAPTTFHALGSRVAFSQQRTGFEVSITNVPGPQFPLYAGGAKMLQTFPVHPLLPGHGLAIGITSYDGRVHYGITADRDTLPDIDLFADLLGESLEELVETTGNRRRRVPRGRAAGKEEKA